MKKSLNLLILCSCVSLFCLSGCCINVGGLGKVKYEKTITLQTPLDAGSNINVKTCYGSITAQGSNVSDCNVVADICVHAPTEQEAMEIAEQIAIRFEQNGKNLAIKADKPSLKRNRSIGISYKITVPKQTSINCSSSYGSIKLNDLNGDIDANCCYGKIDCTNIDCKTIKLNSSYSKINCENIISDYLKANSCYGKIRVGYSENASPELHAEANVSYGNIDFTMPDKFAGQIELATSYGSINSDMPIKVKGKINNKQIKGSVGQGNGSLHLKSCYGSIRLQ